ncbi:hypothetical protein R3P38DRAFT_3038596 [Favolaschia claudopus]|uniref:Gelsolin n=1 Tax=Favolaschia claudopus TaxID=2862362 RepID=A0AAW0A8Z9_9AGAR
MDSHGSQARSSDSRAGGGLSEWASKVKDTHRQVDVDETDQKRLEDEIAASRLARLRRSHGIGSGSRTNSLDLSKHKEYSSALRSEDTTSTDDLKPQADRQKSQSDALNKLMGSTSSPMPGNPPAASNRPEPMSLAAFMGGKATGPRLNRHAPQQDVSDPTQYVQRTRIDAPHPIFGRGGAGGIGGVALPGMAKQPSPALSAYSPARTPEPRDRRRSTPSPEKLESPPASPQRASVRERTMSTPTGATTPKNQRAYSPLPPSSPAQTPSFRSTNQSNVSLSSSAFPTGKHTSPAATPVASKSPVVTPSLARPVKQDPSPKGPQISASHTPSQAFLRAPAQKDLTPSLSRLQGRGFVQNMVKASAQLDSPAPSPSPEKSRSLSGRKSSVLDRWPSPSPATSPPPSPTAAPMRRAKTVDAPAQTAPSVVKTAPMSKSYSDGGNSNKPEPVRPVKPTPGLGSASTVVLTPTISGVDEHGYKRKDDPLPTTSKTSTLPETSSKPLVHPTKDRAKKPKKNRVASSEPDANLLSSQSSMVPTVAPTAPPLSSSREDLIHSRPLPTMAPAQTSGFSAKPAESTLSRSGSGMAGRRALPGMTQSSVPANVSNMPWDTEPETSLPAPKPSSGMVGRRALPGMTQSNGTPPSISPKPSIPVPQFEPIAAPRALPGLSSSSFPGTSQQDSFDAHPRPSSAGRPTVMDMAQALADPPRKLSPTPPPPPPPVEDEPAELPAARPRAVIPNTSSQNRRSSYDRYSFVLPPLKEEATPDPTPVSTLTRAVGNSFAQPDFDFVSSKLNGHAEEPSMDELIQITHADDPLPRVDVSPLVQQTQLGLSKDSQTIQVDVMGIEGSSAFPLGLNSIFYDTEILAIIHRSKSNSTGLMTSTVWSWEGKRSSMGESEERKLAELAKRYGTSIVTLRQFSEPVELVQCLGGTLSIRQGSRAHWANDNTAVHIVRALNGVIHIDQVDLEIKNLCSGFSYCVTILNSVYVWHGRGSTPVERKAALDYATSLTSDPDEVTVLLENEDDDDEMFWMVLGDAAEYAKAEYWRWRPSIATTPRIWCVDASQKKSISPVHSFRQQSAPHRSVYVLDCVFEFFILVPSGARGKRRDIRLAISVAEDAATRLASSRPYTPTVHALILPSQLPMDLRVQFRDLEEVFLSNEEPPDHMNILPSREAQNHLQTTSWSKSQLKDPSMLPLGLDEDHIATS